jgi:hypothetical protein
MKENIDMLPKIYKSILLSGICVGLGSGILITQAEAADSNSTETAATQVMGAAKKLALPVTSKIDLKIGGSVAGLFGVGSTGNVRWENGEIKDEDIHIMNYNMAKIKFRGAMGKEGNLKFYLNTKFLDNRNLKKDDFYVSYKLDKFTFKLGTNNPLEGSNFSRGAMVVAPIPSRYETNTGRMKGNGLGVRYKLMPEFNTGIAVYDENRVAANAGWKKYKAGTSYSLGANGKVNTSDSQSLEYLVAFGFGVNDSFNGYDTWAAGNNHLGLKYNFSFLSLAVDYATAFQKMPPKALGESVKAEKTDASFQFLMPKAGPGAIVATFGSVESTKIRTDDKTENYLNLVYAFPLEKRIDLHIVYATKETKQASVTSNANFMGLGLYYSF